MRAKFFGDFREHVDPGADVFAAFRVVRRSGQKRMRPVGLPLDVLLMKGPERRAEPFGISSDFVQRHEPVVPVKRGIFDRLRHDRARHLLEFAREAEPCRSVGFVDRGRVFQDQDVAQKVKTEGLIVGFFRFARAMALSM